MVTLQLCLHLERLFSITRLHNFPSKRASSQRLPRPRPARARRLFCRLNHPTASPQLSPHPSVCTPDEPPPHPPPPPPYLLPTQWPAPAQTSHQRGAAVAGRRARLARAPQARLLRVRKAPAALHRAWRRPRRPRPARARRAARRGGASGHLLRQRPSQPLREARLPG
jgi:hypothetical protein